MFCLKFIGKILLIPIWIILTIVGILVKLIVNIVSIAKSFIVLGLIGLVIGTIICYRDWVHIVFLLCLIVSAFLGDYYIPLIRVAEETRDIRIK